MPLAHEVLGVRPGAPGDEVRAAFRRFARRHHPDRGGDPEKFRKGLEAYRRLIGLGAPAGGAADVVFHRRRRGLAALAAAWSTRNGRRRRRSPVA